MSFGAPLSASPLATPTPAPAPAPASGAGGDGVPPLADPAFATAGDNSTYLAPPAHAPARSATSPLAAAPAVRENSGPIQLPRRRRTHPVSRRTDDVPAAAGPAMPAVQRVVSDLFTPEHPVGPAPTFVQSIRAFFLSSWV